MPHEVIHRWVRMLAPALLMANFAVACATPETNALQRQRTTSGSVAPAAAATPSPVPRQALAAARATARPFREIVNQVKSILDRYGITQRPARMLLGEMTYQSTEFASPLSGFLRERLFQEFQYAEEILLIEPPRLRGLEVVEKPKTTAALAAIAGVDAWLSGHYSETAEGLDLQLSVTRRPGNQVLGVVRVMIPSSALPGGVEALPANIKEALANQKFVEQIAPEAVSQANDSLKVEAWTDRGKSAVYVEGDELLVFVRVNRDAYVHLYYTDAANQTFRIFPNRYHADEKIPGNIVKRIPEPRDAFIFRIKEPFGVESITALASAKPLGDLNIATRSAGPFQRLERGIRGLEVVSSAAKKGQVVRDRFVVTTIPSMGTSDASWD